MSSQEMHSPKPVKRFDSAYGFSFAIAIGLILFIGGLIVSLTLGQGSTIGLVFGIPLLLAGLIVPLLMMRGQFRQTDISAACPYCGAVVKTSDSAIRLECPACSQLVVVRDGALYRMDG